MANAVLKALHFHNEEAAFAHVESKRFLETAEKVEASNDPKEFERAFKRVVPPKVSKPKGS